MISKKLVWDKKGGKKRKRGKTCPVNEEFSLRGLYKEKVVKTGARFPPFPLFSPFSNNLQLYIQHYPTINII